MRLSLFMGVMMRLFSPSKINLFFKVIKKRDDLFHEIVSLFQATSLGDYLTINISTEERDVLKTDHPALSCGSDNLILQAAELFRKKTGKSIYIDVFLEKNIPMEGGLGGGSGNAATALWAMNALSHFPLSDDELMELGGKLGSDVPFFFSSGRAICRGRGEIIEDTPFRPNLKKVYLAIPPFGVSTPRVFEVVNCKMLPSINPLSLLRALRNGETPLMNDLEPSAFFVDPRLAKLKQKLLTMPFDSVTMSGSGSTFFCMGNVEKPSIDGVQFYEVDFLSRKPGLWYDGASISMQATR